MYIEATAERDGDFWFVQARQVPGAFAQVRRLDQAEEAIREVLDMYLATEDVSDWQIEINPVVTGRPRRLVDVARWLRETSSEAESLAQAATAVAAHYLVSEGVSQRDIGQLLGLSFQRVSQLLAKYPEPMTVDQMRDYLTVLEAGLGGVREALKPRDADSRVEATPKS